MYKLLIILTIFLLGCKNTFTEEVAPTIKSQLKLNLIGEYSCYLNYDYNKDSIYIGKSILRLDTISIKSSDKKYKIDGNRFIFDKYIKFNSTTHQYFYSDLDSKSFKIIIRDKNTFYLKRLITLNFGGTNNIDTQETILFRKEN